MRSVLALLATCAWSLNVDGRPNMGTPKPVVYNLTACNVGFTTGVCDVPAGAPSGILIPQGKIKVSRRGDAELYLTAPMNIYNTTTIDSLVANGQAVVDSETFSWLPSTLKGVPVVSIDKGVPVQ